MIVSFNDDYIQIRFFLISNLVQNVFSGTNHGFHGLGPRVTKYSSAPRFFSRGRGLFWKDNVGEKSP
jgi:hypothetical protein